MFESGLSLQGMTRTVLGVSEVKKNNLPYINIYTNKCYGGISASFAGVSDLAFAEKSTRHKSIGPVRSNESSR